MLHVSIHKVGGQYISIKIYMGKREEKKIDFGRCDTGGSQIAEMALNKRYESDGNCKLSHRGVTVVGNAGAATVGKRGIKVVHCGECRRLTEADRRWRRSKLVVSSLSNISCKTH